MIDWFVLFVPLALLPLFLLLVFVGCGLPRQGTGPTPASLQFGPGSFANVQSVEVTFTFVLGEIAQTSGPLLVNAEQITPDNVIVFSASLLSDAPDVTCACAITLKEAGTSILRSRTVATGEGSGVHGAFQLSGDEFGFPLDFIFIELVGGL